VPDPAAVGPSFIQIGNEGGFLPSATVLPNTPVGYEYFRRTVTVLNVTNHTLLLAPAERADVIVDFSQVPAGSKLIMYNDAPAPMPGFDSRNDYYTGDPDQTLIGGAPTTQAGYGPNTRTIMQFDVEGATADPPFNLTALETGLRAAYAASQDKPIVPEPAYGPVYNTTYPDNLVGLTDATMTYTPAGASQPTSFTLEEKAIIEGFDMDYGRMNAQLGGNLPNLGPQQGTATPYDYVDAPTDQATDTIPGTQIGALQDGTQIWRLDHQGVDTHAIHFHLFNVQVIERVAIDGQIFPIDPNEYGWKETIRTNPGQDVIVALRPVSQTLPFKLPDSIRLINPALPEGATWTDSNGTVVTNTKENFGWEYVWHCHLLGHEENDMMRPFVFKVAPDAPSGLGATPGPSSVSLNWTNNAGWPVATNYVIQRARNAAFTSGVTNISRAGTPTSFSDTGLLPLTQYFYRVRAEDAAGYSTWTTPVSATTLAGAPTAATGLRITATSRTALGIAWTNGLGATSLNVQYSTRGATGPWTNYGGALGPTATTRTMTGLRPLTTYWIRIMSNNGVGSTPSAVVVGTTPR
jgi:FtsP/CotA-like multicopper oxidase with cupredoxin domain